MYYYLHISLVNTRCWSSINLFLLGVKFCDSRRRTDEPTIVT